MFNTNYTENITHSSYTLHGTGTGTGSGTGTGTGYDGFVYYAKYCTLLRDREPLFSILPVPVPVPVMLTVAVPCSVYEPYIIFSV